MPEITMGRTKNGKESKLGSTSPTRLRVRLSGESLADAVELNYAEWLRLQGRLPWVQFRDDGDALRLFAGDTWPRNNVALARFTAETASRRVGEILAPHLRRKVACNWVVGTVSLLNPKRCSTDSDTSIASRLSIPS